MNNSVPTSRFFSYGCAGVAGVVSALMQAFAMNNGNPILFLLAYISATPLLIAGLALGIGPGLFACAFALAALMAASSLDIGFFYFVADAAPAAGLLFLMQGRRQAENKIEWVPEGQLLASLAVYCALVFAGGCLALSGHKGGLLGMTQEMFASMSDQLIAAVTASGQTLPPEMVESVHKYLHIFAQFAPGAIMCMWLCFTLVALALAVYAVRALKLWDRPNLSLRNLRVPVALVYASGIGALLALFAPAPFDYLGLNLAILLITPSFVQGLAVVHAWTAQSRSPMVMLLLFYTVISVVIHLALLVAILGVADEWIDFRKRFAERAASKLIQGEKK